MKKIFFLFLLFLFVSRKAEAQYSPVAATGYSMDAIAETTTALLATTGAVDGVNVLYSQAYGALIGTTYGLPNSGILSSATKTFQLQNYAGPNSVYIGPGTQDSLTFVTPAACEALSLLNMGADVPTGGATMDVIVRFMDNSTQLFSGLAIYDWFNTTATSFAGGFDRANRTSGTSGGNGSAGNPRLFTNDISLSCVNQNKKIKRIIFKNVNSVARITIFAVSAIQAPANIDVTATLSSYCNTGGASTTLSMTGVSNFTWLPVDNFAGSNSTTITVSPSVTTEYTVQAVGLQTSSGCSIFSVFKVTVYPLPVLSAMVSPAVLCVGKTATLNAAGASSYTWASSGLATAQTTVNPVLTTSYTYSGTSQYGCVSTSVIAVTVNTNSLTVSSNTTICSGKSITLTVSGAQTYTWTSGSYYSISPVNPTVTTTYTVTGTDIYSCILNNSVTITVNARPIVTVSASQVMVCRGETIDLTASGANTYSWSNAQSGTQITVQLPVDVAYTYTVTGTNSNGCSNTAAITVTGLDCTGIESIHQNSDVKAYPNPAMNVFMLETNSTAEKTIQVMDAFGKVVLSVRTADEKMEVNIADLANGVYYLKVTTGKTTDVKRFVKVN